MTTLHRVLRQGVLFGVLLGSGCASYMTPGGSVSIPAITDADVAEAMQRQPAAQLPVRLAVSRVQASGYVSSTNKSFGRGGYSVVTARDVETEEDFQRLARLSQVQSVAPLTRILLPADLQTSKELRTAAAQLRADILIIYTFDTSFQTDTTSIGPLQMVSLGFFPNHNAKVTATCSAALIDVRTGFVYGSMEDTAYQEQRSDLWRSEEAIDKARGKAERQAFEGMLEALEEGWPSVLATVPHAG